MNQLTELILIPSSRKRRIAAFCIDHIVMSALMVSLVFLMIGPGFIDRMNNNHMGTSILAVIIPLFFIYFTKDSIHGISIGKWIMGIMVRNENDYQATPSFWKLFIRNIFIVVWPVEFIVLAVRNDKKRIGDLLAKTAVVKSPVKPARLPRIMALTGLILIIISFIIVFTGTAMKNSDAYKVALQNIEMNKDILEESGGITGYGLMPTGNISISDGRGQAQLQISVLGKSKNMKVYVYLTKEPDGPWTLIKMNK